MYNCSNFFLRVVSRIYIYLSDMVGFSMGSQLKLIYSLTEVTATLY